MELFNILGSKCVKCGFTDVRALQFDHIYGSGNVHNRVMGGRHSMLKYFSKNPELARIFLQVLCANCNWIKRAERGEVRGNSFDPEREKQKEEEGKKIQERQMDKLYIKLMEERENV